jgi:putative ABC transport system permease protein
MAGSTRVAVVSRNFAQRAWPNQDPIGKILLTAGATPVRLTIIGMVSDVEHGGRQFGANQQADVYLSIFQSPPRSPALLTLIVRTGTRTATVLPALQEVLKRNDPSLAIYDVQTLQARLDGQTSTGRFLVTLMASFALLGLTLAAVGVYAVIAYTVSQRTREVGIRMALGAHRSQVITQVVQQGLTPVLAGITFGLAALWYLQRFMGALLYGLSPLDPPTLASTAFLLILVGTTASLLPALRAARVPPVVALRHD